MTKNIETDKVKIVKEAAELHLNPILRDKAYLLLKTLSKISNPSLSHHQNEVSVTDLTHTELSEEDLDKILQFIEDCLTQIRTLADIGWSGKNVMERPSFGPKFKGPYIQGSKVVLNTFFDYYPFISALSSSTEENGADKLASTPTNTLVASRSLKGIYFKNEPELIVKYKMRRLNLILHLFKYGETKTSDLTDNLTPDGSDNDYDVEDAVRHINNRFIEELKLEDKLIIGEWGSGYRINEKYNPEISD